MNETFNPNNKMFSLATLVERGFDFVGFSEAVREKDKLAIIVKHPDNFMKPEEQDEYAAFCHNIVSILNHWELELAASFENPLFSKN